MGKNQQHQMQKAQRAAAASSSYNDEDRGAGQMAMSKEYEQAQIDKLLNPVERPSWDQFKEQQRLKNEAEGAEARREEEAQRRFRKELDEARMARLGDGSSKDKDKKKKDKSKKDKHKSKKHKSRHDKSDKKKKKKKRKRHSSSSSGSSDSSDSEEPASAKKAKIATNADGAVSLRSFFDNNGSDSE